MEKNEEVVSSLISRIVILLGLKEEGLPSDTQRAMMIHGIVKYYGQYTPEELFLACEMNHYGKYDQRVEHYGKFTIDYLSNCLQLFNDSKKKAILKAKSIEPKIEKLQENVISDEEKWKEIYLALETFIKQNNSLPIFWDWNGTYNYLKINGRLKSYTVERMKEIYEKISSQLKGKAFNQRIEGGSIGQMIESERIKSKSNVQNECRKFVVEEVLKNELSDFFHKA